jgi:hypothetical protein
LRYVRPVNLHVEILLGARWNEMAGYLSKLRLGDGEWMFSGPIPGLESRQADLLGDIEQVEDMRRVRLVEEPRIQDRASTVFA